MKMERKIMLGVIFIFAILFLQIISAESISNIQTSPFNKEEAKTLDKSLCQEGKDFLVQISPFGCTPAVVRTDLLEENNVQVLCQLGATQINPLIDVQTIDSISFSGNFSKEVSAIGFHPAKAALGVKGDLNSPVLNNIGYVAINLKKQPNASAVPDFVEGKLTAKIKYNIKNALGIGNAQIYLPELSEKDWETKRYQYNFWNGKGTLKAESIEADNAQISVYSKEKRISSVSLKKGETSNMIYLPGLECSAGAKLRLDGLENPSTRATLRINAEVVEVAEGEKFLDNKCSVRNLEYRGINQNVNIKCIEDGKTSDFSLSINPKIILDINGEVKEYSIGDWLYDTKFLDYSGSMYLGYIGTNGDSRNVNDLFIYTVFSPQKKARLNEEQLHTTSILVGELKEAGQTATGYVDIASNAISRFAGLIAGIGRQADRGEYYWKLDFGKKEQIPWIQGIMVSIATFAGAQDVELTGNAKEYYDNAKADYETIRESYSSETYPIDATSTFGEEAFYKEILLAWNAKQKKIAYDLCQEYIQAYPNSKKDLSYCTDAIKLANQDTQEVYVTINGEVKTISFDGINEPTFSDYGATVRINSPDGTVRNFDLRKNAIIYLDRNQEAYKLISGVGTAPLYFKHVNGIWSWSYDKITWVTSPDLNSATQLINQLRGKSLDEGRTILTNQGAQKDTIIINDYLQLNAIDDNSVNIRTSLNVYGASEVIAKEFTGGIITLQKDVPKDLGTGYVFTLTKINLKKTAKVSVLPNINNAGTEADFSFKIGIEKRAINLPPEQIRNIINTLNKTIDDWGKISTTLETVTKGLQAGCLAAGTALTIKNFALGTGGAGIARQTVMRGSNGWTEKCASLVASETYTSQDQCYVKNADKIDKDVAEVSKIIEQQNSQIKQLESGITKTEFLTDSIVNTSAFMSRYTPEVRKCIDSIGNFRDPNEKGTAVTSETLNSITYDNWKDNKFFNKEDLRDIELYCNILKSSAASDELKQAANQRIYSNLVDIRTNSENFLKTKDLASRANILPDQVGFIEEGQNLKKYRYEGLTLGKIGRGVGSYGENTPVYLSASSSGNTYLFILDDSSGTANLPIKRENGILQIYNYNTNELIANPPLELTNIYFQKIDASSYQNQYKNAKLSYYETEPYKGLPAIVPFDLKNGWYAATKQTLPTGGSIQPFDASARPNSFWLCNVGANGLEEFQTVGDDTCQMINLGTGMSYEQSAFGNERETKTLIDKGIQAITQASRLYKAGLSGKVNILGNSVDVGSPAADIPQFQCQDFMSPNECLLLFNLCDPVICPSSRCDLGGAYPVKDVVQTGIIGSLVLCLPNIQEGIIFPVCLTGVKAGIEGFLSILTSARDCFQENLKTGKVVGICDEISSVYLCDFFWKQALPLADIAVPKIVESLTGQNVRGGGEYAGVESSWNLAQQSISFFTNYYGANAKDAFLARTTETVKSEVCKSWVSAVVPTGADFINKITTPASPAQFTGRFDEIPLTTATVPPTSHYKVFYHIFAGKDSGAYYQVYLKGSPESSYYQDASQNLAIASGYIAVGGYATETKDLTSVSGYNQLCINVNGQEECGFKEVSTDFALNYVKDQYLKSQITETDIKTEAECISGSASVYNVLSPNVQAGVEEAINPAIYNRGITRICATENPGSGTDTNVFSATRTTGSVITGNVAAPETTTTENKTTEEKTPVEETPTITEEEKKIVEDLTKHPGEIEGPRWVQVGYCGNEKIKCWLDTQNVKDIIKTKTVAGESLDEVTQNHLDILRNEGNYLSEKDFSSSVQEIEKEKDNTRKITLIGNVFDKAFWSTEKAQLILLRGNAYTELLKVIVGTQPKPQPAKTDTGVDLASISDARQRVLASAKSLEGTIVPAGENINCLSAAAHVYELAGIPYRCVYGDKRGDSYTLTNGRTLQIGVDKRPNGIGAAWVNQYENGCNKISKSQKLERLSPGDLIFYVWSASSPAEQAKGINNDYDHAAIFVQWVDKANGKALLFDWNGAAQGNSWGIKVGQKDSKNKICTDADSYVDVNKNKFPFCAVYRYYELDISDDSHPVYVFQNPYSSGETPPSSAETPVGTSISSTSPKEVESPTTITPKATAGDKIYDEAVKLTGNKYISSADFVSLSLINTGINLGKITSNPELISFFDKNENFVEVGTDFLTKGDLIILGYRCDVNYRIAVFSGWDIKNKQVAYLSLEATVKEYKRSSSEVNENVGDLFSSFIYRAYRYVGDLTPEEKANIVKVRDRWTKQTALDRISPQTSSPAPLAGNYDKNQQFVNELILDGLLTEQECKDVRGGLFGIGQKDINWVKLRLLEKQ